MAGAKGSYLYKGVGGRGDGVVAQETPVLETVGITRSFPGVVALKGINLRIHRGEILGLVGENGAGKSTLLKILSGAIQPTEGQILLDGRVVDFRSPADAQRLGIASVYQNVYLVPNLTVAENLFLGDRSVQAGVVLNGHVIVRHAQEQLAEFGFTEIDPRARVRDLSPAQRQLTAIAKSLAANAKVLLLDEPTSSLSEGEVSKLFAILRGIQGKGTAVIFVSHHIEEIFEIANNIVVLRDGELASCGPVGEYSFDRIKTIMAGGRGRSTIPLHAHPEACRKRVGTRPILSVRGLTKKGSFKDVSFDLFDGEILGFAGLVGSGRTELAKAIFGALPYDAGEILMDGNKARVRSVWDAIRLGIYYLTEDRLNEGVFPLMSVTDNIVISNPTSAMTGPVLRQSRKEKVASSYVEQLSIKVSSIRRPISELSGGNQQKCLFARLLNAGGKVLLLDEPTNGIDVSTKDDIHRIIDDFVSSSGRAVILISSDLPEVLAMSDRVAIMREGKLVGVFPRSELDKEKVLNYMLGASW